MRIPLLCLLLCACYNPALFDSNSPRYLCDESMQCPDGLSCSAGLCLRPGEVPLTSGDMAGLDAKPPEPPPAPPCKSGVGYVLDGPKQQTAACPGKFSTGGASAQCAAGFMLCGMVSASEKAACDGIQSGFFASSDLAAKTGGGPGECGRSSNHTLIPGCGGRRLGIEAVDKCGVFDHGIDCFEQGAIGWVWACDGSTGIIAASYGGLPGGGAVVDGVLCCKM